jgi:hypothetical protein
MRKLIILLFLSTLTLVGCDRRISRAVGDLYDLGKSFFAAEDQVSYKITGKPSWAYSEEIDKLNNIKIQKATREFRNNDDTVKFDVEFQCHANKALILQIGAYETKLSNGRYYEGSMLKLENIEGGTDFIKTRTGSNKLAFPVSEEQEFGNIAKFSLLGINSGGVEALKVLAIELANLQLSLNASTVGYKYAADGDQIKKAFTTSEWIIEVKTEDGKAILDLDLSHRSILKVFDACSWSPEFVRQQDNKTPLAIDGKTQLKDTSVQWRSGWGQGTAEYFVEDGSSSILIACPDGQPATVSVRINGLEMDKDVRQKRETIFTIDGKSYTFTSWGNEDCRVCASSFPFFWNALREAKSVTVTSSSAGQKNFTVEGLRRALPPWDKAQCTTTQ